MRLVLTIDTKNPSFPKNGITLIQNELEKRIGKKIADVDIIVKSAPGNNMKFDGMKDAQKKLAKSIVEEMFDEADQWLTSND